MNKSIYFKSPWAEWCTIFIFWNVTQTIKYLKLCYNILHGSSRLDHYHRRPLFAHASLESCGSETLQYTVFAWLGHEMILVEKSHQRILDAGFQVVDVLAVHANLPFTQNAPGSKFQIHVGVPVFWFSEKEWMNGSYIIVLIICETLDYILANVHLITLFSKKPGEGMSFKY